LLEFDRGGPWFGDLLENDGNDEITMKTEKNDEWKWEWKWKWKWGINENENEMEWKWKMKWEIEMKLIISKWEIQYEKMENEKLGL